MTLSSALYTGDVMHARHRPVKHRLRYRVFCMLLDLDELGELDRSLWLFGHNRRAVFSFHDADHGYGTRGGLGSWVRERLAEGGIVIEGLRVRVLCYPRIFGYVFNPLTVYFCEDADGETRAILYEVCNTFHERHTYIIGVGGAGDTVRHACEKKMYVSPFMPMACTYHFRIRPPGDNVMIAIDEHDAGGSLLFASFTGRRRALGAGALLRALFTYPLMTLKVMGAIHWEALLLWARGVPVHRHGKAAEKTASSVVPHGRATPANGSRMP